MASALLLKLLVLNCLPTVNVNTLKHLYGIVKKFEVNHLLQS